MKQNILFTRLSKLSGLFILICTLSCCDSAIETTQLTQTVLLRDVRDVLNSADSMFYVYGAETGGNIGASLIKTQDWLSTQPGVKEATVLDSMYLYITLTSGLETVYFIDLVDDKGISLARGGGGGNELAHFTDNSKDILSQNLIANKKVLFYCPGFVEFYDDGEFSHIQSVISGSTANVTLTTIKDDECLPKEIERFSDYGLVIISTHGAVDGYMTGLQLIDDNYSDAPNRDSAISWEKYSINNITNHDGTYELLVSGDLRIESGRKVIANVPDWHAGGRPFSHAPTSVWVTSKYIASLAPMPNTVIFGNMCYSGTSLIEPIRWTKAPSTKLPIQTAFANLKPISYYGYAYIDGTSAPVSNGFAKKMEDSLSRALLHDIDSTGIAHQSSIGELFKDYEEGGHRRGLIFSHFGKDTYSYSNCISEFTDERDGQKYKAVCIGKQNWMAENLRYVTSGSMPYYSDSAAHTQTYGRLYTWPDMMAGNASSNTNPSNVRGICPKGWHVPSTKEWEELITFIGGMKFGGDLKATTNWLSPNAGATDKYGFHALGSGQYYPDSNRCYFINTEGHWWTSSITNDPNTSDYFVLSAASKNIFIVNNVIGGTANYKQSCRCIKDK